MRLFRPRARKPAFKRLVIDSLPRGGLLLPDTQERVFYGVILGPVAWLQTQPEFVMALLGVLSQDDDMSVVILLFVTLFVPVLLWHKESQK